MKLQPWSDRVDAFRRSHWFYRWVAVPLAAVYLATIAFLGGLHGEHYILAGGLVFVSLWSDWTRRWSKVVLPILLYASVYDSMRFYADYIRSPTIHVREPNDFDVRFFGIQVDGRVLSPPQWWQLHTQPVLDFVTGLAYFVLFFVGESIALALWLYGHGREKRALRFIWVFVVTNFVGFTLYYIYPAAPPWYVADHGFAVDLSVRASAAGALRFDKIVGLPLMEGFYGKSADVFGAIPSLHVAYPFLAACYGFSLKRFRYLAVPYWLLVCFSAVYLNHHYVLDMIVGIGVCLLTMAAFRLVGGPVEASVPEEARESQRQELATP